MRGLGGLFSDSGATSLRVRGDEVTATVAVIVVIFVVLSVDTNGDVRGGLIAPGAAAFMTLGPTDLS